MKAFPNLTSELGMDLRDYFAAKAMQAYCLDNQANAPFIEIANDAYNMADAMMKAREKNGD